MSSESLLSSSSSSSSSSVWIPLSSGDHAVLGITIAYQCVVLAAVSHLLWCRDWPPYVTKGVALCSFTGVAGVIAYIGALIAYGVIYRESGDFLANCAVEALFDYTGWGIWTSAILVRVYRSWKILVRNEINMWSAGTQIMLLTIPWWTPVIAYAIRPSLAPFDELGNWCEINVPIDVFLYVYGTVCIAVAYVMVFQMRRVRRQMNEYRMQVLQLTFLLITGTIVFPLIEEWLDEQDNIRRQWIMFDNVLSSLIIFWPPVAEPIYRYIIRDDKYLFQYTKGFSTLPTPAQMRSSLKDQLSVDQLREEFRKFAATRVAPELPDFYKACLDRDEMTDYFHRQAFTMDIINNYVRVGAPHQVNLSSKIRDKILRTDVTNYSIFDEATAMVLQMMENNFREDFEDTEEYRELQEKVEAEARELEILRKAQRLPASDGLVKNRAGRRSRMRVGSKQDGQGGSVADTMSVTSLTTRDDGTSSIATVEDGAARDKTLLDFENSHDTYGYYNSTKPHVEQRKPLWVQEDIKEEIADATAEAGAGAARAEEEEEQQQRWGGEGGGTPPDRSFTVTTTATDAAAASGSSSRRGSWRVVPQGDEEEEGNAIARFSPPLASVERGGGGEHNEIISGGERGEGNMVEDAVEQMEQGAGGAGAEAGRGVPDMDGCLSEREERLVTAADEFDEGGGMTGDDVGDRMGSGAGAGTGTATGTEGSAGGGGGARITNSQAFLKQ